MPRKKTKSSAYLEMEKEYKRLAHKADTRLRRLEALSNEPGYKNVLNWAYKKAMRSIRYWSGENATRFETKAPNKITSLRAKLSDIKRFLGMVSSTKTGIKETYISRATTLNRKYGTNFTWETMGKFFESKVGMTLGGDEGGSPKVLMAIGEIQAHEDEILEAMKRGEQINLKIKDPLVELIARNILEEYGKDFTKLYK